MRHGHGRFFPGHRGEFGGRHGGHFHGDRVQVTASSAIDTAALVEAILGASISEVAADSVTLLSADETYTFVLSGDTFTYDETAASFTGTLTTITVSTADAEVATVEGLSLAGEDISAAIADGSIADILTGTDIAVEGSDDADVIATGSGSDHVNGGAGDDVISGGDAGDRLSGSDGDDVIDGGAGDDRIMGGAGADSLSGGEGADMIHGGDGDDIIVGGLGDDHLSGGAGADTFVFASGDGDDRIRCFDITEDSITLDLTDSGLTAADVIFTALTDYSATIAYGDDSITLFGTDVTTLTVDDLLIIV